MIGQARHFVGRMADVQHGDVELVVQAFEVGQDFLLECVIQRGQRFVHQQQPRAGGQRPRDADALAFTAGQPGRLAAQQPADIQHGNRLIERHPAVCGSHPLLPELQVGQHGEVRKQAGLLKHIAQRAFVDGHESCAVLPDIAIDDQRAARRGRQTGHGAQEGGLAGTGRAE
jgi:hypothetical protein